MGKTKKGPKRTSKKYTAYEVSGTDLKRKNIFCPKCGDGTFMAKHKNRISCGKCHYMEKTSVKS